MLNSVSVLETTVLQSPLASQSMLRPRSARNKRPLLFSLMLTSLIDAFSILVIYLLINFSATNQSLQMSQELELPPATQSTDVGIGTVITLNNGHYFVEGKEVTIEQIARRLYDIRRSFTPSSEKDKESIIIEADKHSDYAQLNPIIMAGAQAGFHRYKFAVLQAEETK